MNELSLQSCTVPKRIENVSLEIPSGSLVGLIGPNGSGKSSLLQVAGGLLPSSGRVFWRGENPLAIAPVDRARHATWVPQEVKFEFGFTVRSVVAQGRYAFGDDGEGIDDALAQFDLRSLADRPVTQLSGGEKHRVVLARACVTRAPLQLWDEPLAALDPRHALELLVHGLKLARSGSTVIFSLHDLKLAHCLDLLILMDRGQIRAVGKPEQVLTPPLLLETFGVVASLAPSLTLKLP
ncbi:ABC transporter ATP-binding protein [Nibricoccus sp. IMCC34717]|uniref:ABC transporter ATP-binding protein n=1 Tax=Nibricoccus sp. IMCC34717 TaxID=3034021 RepID=UPI003850273A